MYSPLGTTQNYTDNYEDITEKLTNHIQEKKPILFLKFGDGEYLCASKHNRNGDDANCDADTYTDKLSDKIVESFKYVVENDNLNRRKFETLISSSVVTTLKDENETPSGVSFEISKGLNTYIGKWWNNDIALYWNSILSEGHKIKWADYHTIIISKSDFNDGVIQKKIALYKAIQDTDLKKYIICNPLLVKSKILLNADEIFHVPFQNWFDTQFDNLVSLLCEKIGDNPQPIIITSCGMSAKVLIAEMSKKYPQGIFLDFGSAMDIICTKRDSRGFLYSYETLYEVFKPILPENWHDPSFDYIYDNARRYMGLHC
jgi:hypothetical protein